MSDTFFQRFDEWVAAFDDVEFVEGESDEHHTESAVTLLTKLVFVQTLADYGVVDADWLRKTWNGHERSHGHDGRHAVLDAFFTDVSEQVEAYCDVGLFTRDVYPTGEQSAPGAETVAQNVAAVVGVATDESQGEKTGVADVDFTQLDEDVFGRIYETYLADGRTGHGIYYTPGYVSRSLVADTVGAELGAIATRFEDAVETGRWDAAATAAMEFTEFTVLDPACGTGSFLVAAFDTIRDEYDRLFECLDAARPPRRQSEGAETSENPSEGKTERIEALLRTLGYTEDERGELRLREREFAATLVLRHVHAVDLDSQAL
ncbi:N-6 DNA methylase, partial [Haloferax profundi]